MSLLIFGSSKDPHIASVSTELSESYGIASYLLDDERPFPFDLQLSFDSGLALAGDGFELENVRLLWDRSKLALPCSGSGQQFRAEFVRIAQWLGFYRGLAELAAVRVINRPTTGRFSKLSQLLAARNCGIKIPTTLIPGSKTTLSEHLRAQRSIVTKSIAFPNTPDGDRSGETKAIMTSRVRVNEIADVQDTELTVCPHLFQREVSKQIELRIVATLEQCFAFSTDAHKDDLTAVDWRYGNVYLKFSEREPSDSLVSRLQNYLREMGLIYGVFDIIIDEFGDEWFLECNIEGQWYWLEQRCGAPISQAIAGALASTYYRM